MNLIFNAYVPKIWGGANAYYDCVLVSLITAKQKNPETDVALVTTEVHHLHMQRL